MLREIWVLLIIILAAAPLLVCGLTYGWSNTTCRLLHRASHLPREGGYVMCAKCQRVHYMPKDRSRHFICPKCRQEFPTNQFRLVQMGGLKMVCPKCLREMHGHE